MEEKNAMLSGFLFRADLIRHMQANTLADSELVGLLKSIAAGELTIRESRTETAERWRRRLPDASEEQIQNAVKMEAFQGQVDRHVAQSILAFFEAMLGGNTE